MNFQQDCGFCLKKITYLLQNLGYLPSLYLSLRIFLSSKIALLCCTASALLDCLWQVTLTFTDAMQLHLALQVAMFAAFAGQLLHFTYFDHLDHVCVSRTS